MAGKEACEAAAGAGAGENVYPEMSGDGEPRWIEGEAVMAVPPCAKKSGAGVPLGGR